MVGQTHGKHSRSTLSKYQHFRRKCLAQCETGDFFPLRDHENSWHFHWKKTLSGSTENQNCILHQDLRSGRDVLKLCWDQLLSRKYYWLLLFAHTKLLKVFVGLKSWPLFCLKQILIYIKQRKEEDWFIVLHDKLLWTLVHTSTAHLSLVSATKMIWDPDFLKKIRKNTYFGEPCSLCVSSTTRSRLTDPTASVVPSLPVRMS